MKRVFVQGSYDLINAGHVRSFHDIVEKFTEGCGSDACNCKQKPYLIVGLNSDELMMEHKGRVIIPFEQRKEILLALKDVSQIYKCDSPDAMDALSNLPVDVFCTVPEWVDRQKEAIDHVESKGGEVYLLKYYPEDGEILSSTAIRERVIKGAA